MDKKNTNNKIELESDIDEFDDSNNNINPDLDTESSLIFEDDNETSKDTIKKLRDRLHSCEKEKIENLSGWQRAKADLINLKRVEEDSRRKNVLHAEIGLIEDLIPTLQAFDMAMGNKGAWESVSKDWRLGIEYIHSKFLEALKSRGLQIIDPVGEIFDPNIHEAVGMEKIVNSETNKIVKVMQKGYSLNGKLVSPAKVVVSE